MRHIWRVAGVNLNSYFWSRRAASSFATGTDHEGIEPVDPITEIERLEQDLEDAQREINRLKYLLSK